MLSKETFKMTASNFLSFSFAIIMAFELQRNIFISAANLRGSSSTSKLDREKQLHLSDDDDIQYYQYQYKHGYITDEYFEKQLLESEQWIVLSTKLKSSRRSNETKRNIRKWYEQKICYERRDSLKFRLEFIETKYQSFSGLESSNQRVMSEEGIESLARTAGSRL